ncbi:hypothetical protein N7471_008239 [Penicillium samsonianum]|uniref:uncharacterized protein n=1 Tax=Penicillium samsonianum TaxID=1882272 RepID=UPI0025488249|nr:uncharacterized protein N7471_008239 [Penicillium samsonianum]KAJ6133024.1 hypothetical protein N7471_008239 [Penicillium samsonianum]
MWLLLGFRPLYSRMITVDVLAARAHGCANVNDRSYYLSPAQPTQQPQPILYDPVLELTFPFELTGPDNIPDNQDEVYFPVPRTHMPAKKCFLNAMVSLCKVFRFHANETCEQDYAANTFGAIWTQLLAYADVEGLDSQYICHSLSSKYCSAPKTNLVDTTKLFPKPKLADVQVPEASGERVKVLRLSDFHLDARKGKQDEHLAWTLYTGDLVSHDPASQISKALTQYTETSIYGMLKHYLSGSVFVALSNHDTSPANIDSPHSLPGRLGEQQIWNYEHLAGLWRHEGWISREAAEEARTHYGGYSVETRYGLCITAFNTVTRTGPTHLPNPTDLFYQIVDRYSAHVIANIFLGHTHEDQFMVYYANNGTVQNAENALTTGWIMPSITPLTNLNSGFRLYEVDTGDFNIYEAYTLYSNVSDYPALDHTGPTFEIEYSTRNAYGLAAGYGSVQSAFEEN